MHAYWDASECLISLSSFMCSSLSFGILLKMNLIRLIHPIARSRCTVSNSACNFYFHLEDKMLDEKSRNDSSEIIKCTIVSVWEVASLCFGLYKTGNDNWVREQSERVMHVHKIKLENTVVHTHPTPPPPQKKSFYNSKSPSIFLTKFYI